MKYEIKKIDGLFYYYLDGEPSKFYKNIMDCQDDMEDEYNSIMSDRHKYRCEFCQDYYNENDVEHRIEDGTFTAPYGSTFVIGGTVASVPVCPICQDDLEEC